MSEYTPIYPVNVPTTISKHHRLRATQTDPQELQKLEKVVKRSNKILFQAKTNFPFDVFPDELVIDENQVNVVHKRFFYTRDIESMLITDIKDVSVSTSLVFCSLTIQNLLPTSTPLKLDFLWPKDAHEARRIIQGLMVVSKEGVELSKIDTKLLKDRLRHIGQELSS